MRNVALGLLASIGNLILFVAALSPAARFNDTKAAVVALILSYGLAGAVSRLWSQRFLLTAVPSIGALALGVALLKWSIHLADTAGTFAYAFWRYVLPSSAAEGVVLLMALVAAALGWVAVDRLLHRRGILGGASRAPRLGGLEATEHRAR